MAASRSTFGKRDREMAKAAKAKAKRERREARADMEPEPVVVENDGVSAEELVERLRDLHAAYDDGRINFDDFDAEKSELTDRIAIRMASDSS